MLLCSAALFSIFLIDHAWTYQLEFAYQQLLQMPSLASRMARLMGLFGRDGSGEEEEDIVEKDEETEEEERKEEERKESCDEIQENVTTCCDEHQQSVEEVNCTELIADAKVVGDNDILKELWR